jgi:hypothetical protein
MELVSYGEVHNTEICFSAVGVADTLQFAAQLISLAYIKRYGGEKLSTHLQCVSRPKSEAQCN